MKTAKGLVDYAKAQLGRPYWFGTFGQIATDKLYEYNKGRLPSYYTAADFPRQYGQRVHDCAGLIKGYLWSETPESAPQYAKDYPDISADQMRAQCTETGDISTLPETPGVLIFYSGHVGVYIGNGQAIEARGHAYGVVQTSVKARSWRWWGKLKYLDYGENDMEYISDGTLKIYVNTAKKTLAKIKADTGCTAIINGGLFDGSFKPVCHLKADGKVLAKDQYSYWGFGWDNGKAPQLVSSYEDLDNYISCVCMVRNGKAEKMTYNADVGGARQRTALGIMPDGRIWMYATLTATTPEALQKLALAKGVKDALMLDGGGSTQGISPAGTVKASRIVQNCICLFKDADGEKCPFTEPTANVKNGSRGDGARWVQWMLNQHGYSLDVDGIFGAKSSAALRDFQKKNGLTVDGICGTMTRAVLKEGGK